MTPRKASQTQGDEPSAGAQTPELSWDVGTAYDFFASLDVLHHPERYGLRPSWAAGVRSRLPADERKLLEEIMTFFWTPVGWIHGLPEPKDAASVLWTLHQTPPEERMLSLISTPKKEKSYVDVLRSITEKRSWDSKDLDALRSELDEHSRSHAKDLVDFLDWWARPEEFGELFLSAMQSYYQNFFAEEEKHILPVLQQGADQARELAHELSLPDLLVELSQGVHFDMKLDARKLVMAPAYWSTPLIILTNIAPDEMLFMFGVRPADMSLVPGEMVPDGLLRALKSMADPTRLRILRYLGDEPLTQAELARRLRLRAPTITHHLNALRLAGLVHITLEKEGERRYAARIEAIRSTFSNLAAFLENKGPSE